MGREILFKAKRVDNGEWVEGYFFAKPILEKYFIILGEHQWMVKPETLCQFTGLTDKNGRKIWENDICSTDIKRPYAVVEFRNGCFMYNLNDGGEDYYDIMLPIEPFAISDKYTEAIGNIFDNPELLKGEE